MFAEKSANNWYYIENQLDYHNFSYLFVYSIARVIWRYLWNWKFLMFTLYLMILYTFLLFNRQCCGYRKAYCYPAIKNRVEMCLIKKILPHNLCFVNENKKGTKLCRKIFQRVCKYNFKFLKFVEIFLLPIHP